MKIGCILVTYNPDIELLTKVLSKIINQVDKVFISDNSTNGVNNNFDDYYNVKYHSNSGNIGIASAQNAGINYFTLKSFDFILFLDQDSIPSDNLVFKLYNTYLELTKKDFCVGGIGPRPYNRKEKTIYKPVIKKGYKINSNITEVGEIISSASFIPLINFLTVGKMDDSLFIDGVDHEWCWRARKEAKLRFFIVDNVLLSHQLGEGDRLFFFKKVSIPTPFRTYYQFRNYFYLVKRSYVPLYWKVSNGFKYAIKYFYFSIFISPQFEYFCRINKGIIDGVFKK